VKAIVQDIYGSADVLELRDIDRPAIGDDEVLVRVRAAGVDPGVWHLMTGRPYLVRAMGFGFSRPKVAVRGRDLAGVVDAVGVRVKSFRPGDEVYGTCESVRSPSTPRPCRDGWRFKPVNISFDRPRCAHLRFHRNCRACVDGGRVQSGQQVMVIGAGGGWVPSPSRSRKSSVRR